MRGVCCAFATERFGATRIVPWVAQIVRGEAENGEQSQPAATEDSEGGASARIETRTWPATLTIAYEGTPLSTRSSGTWACGN